MSDRDSSLNDCGCCEGVAAQTPASISNPHGLTALAYRVGTHSRFKQSMLAGLTSEEALRGLKTRQDDDPTIGVFDAWATVLDVLSFYQERIANEGYLRTATDRRSLLELARSIGYELRPGVAASTVLAFTMETAAGAPRQATLGIGIKAQSVPEENQQAQTFETIEEIVARPEFNKLRPRTTQTQNLVIDGNKLRYASGPEARFLYFNGTSTGLTPGDLLLITTDDGTKVAARRVLSILTDDENKRTKVQIEGTETPKDSHEPLAPTDFDITTFPPGAPARPFTEAEIKKEILGKRWREKDLETFLKLNHWNGDDLIRFAARWRAANVTPASQNVFVFRERAGFFGNNAPPYASLRNKNDQPLFKDDWDKNGWPIWTDPPNASSTPTVAASGGQTINSIQTTVNVGIVGEFVGKAMSLAPNVLLERSIPGVLKNSWVVFSSDDEQRIYRVASARESSAVGFGMSGKATALKVTDAGKTTTDTPAQFLVRDTVAHVKAEDLELAPTPVVAPIKMGTTALTLEQMVLGLKVGQLMVLSGEQPDAPGIIREELLEVQQVIHHDGLTTVLFREQSLQAGLLYSYRRETVALNANVARATHGETKSEVLGSGEAARGFQKFLLKQTPLTYVSAPTPTGLASTLEVRVNDILWEESSTFYGVSPQERTFITRRGDDGKVAVQFGDGVTGARLPSGVENVRAKYRAGIGLGGNVNAKQISLLLTRPLGLKEVTNPFRASGAADPETRDQAREKAPFTVLTLDRIVSLQDFEDFARAYPGIGKARAVWLWDGERKVIHITIAGADGSPVPVNSTLYQNLLLSIQSARDPGCRVRLDSFEPLTFNLEAKLLLARGYLSEKVHAAVAHAVRSEFSFERRAFGQGVSQSEVFAVMQSVEGVEAVDLDKLYLGSKASALESRLPARTAEWNASHNAIRAAELLLVNEREIKLTAMT